VLIIFQYLLTRWDEKKPKFKNKEQRQMKVLKKMAAVMTSLACAAVCAAALIIPKVEAATYATVTPGDLNLDGTVTLADYLVLSKYLAGTTNAFPDVADVNRDGIVNDTDLNLVMKYCLGDIQTLGNPYSAEIYAPSGSVTYVRHYFGPGAPPPSPLEYTLTTNAPTPPAGATPRTVFGADDRVPYSSSSVEIGIYNRENEAFDNIGSAFIIGTNSIVTAAHCVYNVGATAGGGSWMSGNGRLAIRVRTSNDVFIYNVVEVHIPKEFTTSSNNTTANIVGNYTADYARGRVDTGNVNLGSVYGKVTLGTATDAFTRVSVNNSLAAAGYPKEKLNGIYIGYGKNLAGTSNDNFLGYDCDTTKGMSGGPLFYDADKNPNTKNDLTAIGLNAYQNPSNKIPHNGATRFNEKHLQFFFNTQNWG